MCYGRPTARKVTAPKRRRARLVQPKSGPSVPFEAPRFIWWDGRIHAWDDASVHVSRLQWSALGAPFEAMRAYFDPASSTSFVFGLDAHLRRMAHSMRVMEIREPSIETLREATLEVLRRNGARADEYIRIFAWFEDGAAYTTEQPTHAFVLSRTFPSRLAEDFSWTASVVSWRRLDETTVPVRVKAAANYQNSRLAALEALRNGYDFGVLLNARGEVTEGPRECIFLVLDGVLVTPPLSAPVLDSITRRAVLRIATHLGIPVVERVVLRGELYEATEMLACSTASEIVPVVSVDKVVLGTGRPGPVTTRIRELFREVVYGRVELLADLRTAVSKP